MLRVRRYYGGELVDITQGKNTIFDLFAYRLTHGIGSWHCRRSTWLSAIRELPHPISPIFCRGQCYSIETLFFKSSFDVWIWLELELLVLALESSSWVSCIPCVLKVDPMICLVIVVPLDNCEIVKYIECVFSVIALPATSLLFFFRVKAVYRHSRIIITIFGIFWLAIAGLSILLTFSIRISE